MIVLAGCLAGLPARAQAPGVAISRTQYDDLINQLNSVIIKHVDAGEIKLADANNLYKEEQAAIGNWADRVNALSAPSLVSPVVPPTRTYMSPPMAPPPTVDGTVVESHISGDYKGWEGDTIYKLDNGEIWEQDGAHYHYHYAYHPAVTIYPSGGRWRIKVDSDNYDSLPVYVKRIK